MHLIVNIPTLCEVCNSVLWLSGKGLSCKSCKYTIHEKCLQKADRCCYLNAKSSLIVSSSTPKHKSSVDSTHNFDTQPRVFGAPLEMQVMLDQIPLIVDKLISTIELVGLFTEGLYRKSAGTSKVREIKGRFLCLLISAY